MKFKSVPMEKKGLCACGKKTIKRGHDFIADVDANTFHTRNRCRPLSREDVFGKRV